MRHHILLLAAIAMNACEQASLNSLTEVSSDSRVLSSLTISLDPAEGMPSNILFHDPLTLVEPSAFRLSDGAPSGLAVQLDQEELEQLRVVINDLHRFDSIDSFQSIRSPDTSVPTPKLPSVSQKLSVDEHAPLQIRSSSIFEDAYYIDEFAAITNKDEANTFLSGLLSKITNSQAKQAIRQLLNRK